MRRNRFKIRIRLWLALAVAIASLGFTASASARLYMGDINGPTVAPAPIVVTPNDGFNWGDALVGAGIALAIAASGVGVVYFTRHHRRTGLAT